MSDDNKEVVIKISAKNLTKAEFDAARKQLSGLADDTEKAAKKTKAAKDETNVFAASWKQLTASFAAADLITGAVRGLIDLGANAFKAAGDLVDLRDKTGLSLDFLQRLGHVANMSGSNIDEYSDAIYKMGLNVAKGGEETKRAVEKMGLSWEQFRRLSPEDQFLAIADNINFTSDVQERNATLTAVAGKGISSVIVGLAGDYRNLAADAMVASDRQIEALDKFEDRYQRLKASFLGEIRQDIGRAAEGVDNLGIAFSTLWTYATQGRDAARKAFEDQTGVTKRLDQAARDAAAAQNQGAKSTTDWAAVLRQAEADVRGLDASKRQSIETAKRAGATTDQLTEQYGLSTVALKILEEQTKEDAKARDDASKKAREFRDAQERVRLATADISAETYKSIAALAAKGVSEKDIITLLGENEVTVKRVIASEKERADTSKKAAEVEAKLNADRAADFKKTQDDIAKWLAEGAAKRDALTVATLEASLDAEERMRAAASGSHALRMAELRQAEAAEIKSAREKYDVASPLYQQIEAEIRARYQHERDYANATQSTIVERMREQGVITRTEQAAIVAGFERDYRQMVASGEYSYDELEAAERRWRDASKQMSAAAVLRFVDEMQQALQVGDAVFGLIGGLGNDTTAKIGAVGSRIVSVAQQGSEAMAAFATGQWVQGAIKSIGAISTALQGLFKGNETKKAREEFADSMGLTLDQLYKKLQSMGAEGQRLANQALNVIGKHDEAGNKRWMEEVTAFFGDHEAALQRQAALTDEATLSWQEAEEIMREFGISATNSGKALEQAKIVEQGDNIGVKWRQLIAAGVDFKDTTTGMADEVQQLINRSLEMGIQLPASLREPIEKMYEMGLLTDENGNKLDGLGRLSFAETLTDKIGALVDILTKMVENTRGMGDAAKEANRKAKDAFDGIEESARRVGGAMDTLFGDRTFKLGVDVEWPELPEGYGGGSFEWPDLRPEGFANGGVARGPLLAAIEPGRKEMIGDESFMQRALMGALDKMGIRTPGSPASALAGNGVGQPIALNVYVDGQLRHAEVIDVVNRGLQGQQIQVPLSATSGRIRP